MSADPAFVDEDASSGSGEDVNMLDGHNKRQSATPNSGHRKRSRKAIGDAIVDAMLEIAAASKMRAAAIIKNEERFSISKCIKVLDEMQGVDQSLYFFALDLFENPSAREIFISLKSERQLTWLQGKFSASSNTSRSMEDVDLELDEMELVAAAAGYYYYNSITNQPLRSISPSGSGFMTELLSGPDDLCREMLRMDKHVFHKLCDSLRQRAMLRDTPGVSIEEQLAIFLNIVGHNERNRVIQERFQHSGETISRHFNNAKESLVPGRYYLVDMGYSNTEGFIAPYPGVRCHLHEYRGANLLPRNAEELFNHRHSSLRQAIQTSFDVLKARFPILKLAPQYAFHTQRDIVIAACVIHNLIRREERNDWLFAGIGGGTIEDLPDLEDSHELQLASSVQEQIASSFRDSVAAAMWDDFINNRDE
ncbi:hypothetical protein RJ639_003845, partial [Escallonia herrerae]